MKKSYDRVLQGYRQFKEKYAAGDHSIMAQLSDHGQSPQMMVVSCCDSRVDPALILQCDPGDLFVVRNVANIIPPYEMDDTHHGTSAALEFAVCFLKVKHLILLGHSQCGGIQALLNPQGSHNDFINSWVSLIKTNETHTLDADEYAKFALHESKRNCFTFPWIKEKVAQNQLAIHLWFFDIKKGEILAYSEAEKQYKSLESS